MKRTVTLLVLLFLVVVALILQFLARSGSKSEHKDSDAQNRVMNSEALRAADSDGRSPSSVPEGFTVLI